MPRISITTASTILRAPWVTIGSLFVAIALGLTRSSYLEYLKPVSEFYVAILQMAVLPFLLSVIPLTIRAIMLSGGISGIIKRFILTSIITSVIVCLFSLFISKGLFDLFPIHESTFLKIGTFINSYSDKSDLEISLDTVNTASADHMFSMISIIPANIFSSLAVNDNTQVIIFCLIFGTALFTSSNKIEGHNIYSALHLIQKICSLISVWTYIFLPIGIISLVAPLLGNTTPELYAMLGMFIFSFILACFVVIIISIIIASKMSYNSFSKTSSYLIKPIMMGAACRNTMNCIALHWVWRQ
jgi:Na+/H+-dicarboxylate symporter